jgi:hypothetical protein
MKYAVEMGSSAMIYVASFVNIGSGIQKLIRGNQRQTAWKSHKPTFILFENKRNGLKYTDNDIKSL